MEAFNQTDQPALKNKPRPLGWKRLTLIAFALLMLAVVGLHRGWTIGAGRKLAKQVGEYKARGEPIELADFNVGFVADADNAALDLRAASAAIDRTTDVWKQFNDARDELALPFRDEEVKNVRALIEGNPKVFPLVDSATRKTGFDWGIRFKTPVITTLLPDLQTQRELARFLAADALLAHSDGDDARAIRRLREMLFVARAVDAQQAMLIGHLVSIGITNLSTQTLEQMAGDLRIGDGPRDAKPDEVREVIARRLDESALNEGHRRALLGERMMQLDIAQAIANGKMTLGGMPPNATASALGVLIKPTALGDARLMIRHSTAVRDAFDQSQTWPAFKATAPPFPEDVRKRQWRHMTAAMLMPALDRAVETHYRGLMEGRMGATLLALRWYAVDHGGRAPQTLDRLGPKYLPAVPADAFALTTQPLRYVAGADPIVYSVGVNGADDRGSEQPRAASPFNQQLGRWDKLDAVMHLVRQRRPAPTEADETAMASEDAPEAATQSTTGPSE